ncbi:MAG: hypothetical protein ABL903_02040 [Methylococcales bacterium]
MRLEVGYKPDPKQRQSFGAGLNEVGVPETLRPAFLLPRPIRHDAELRSFEHKKNRLYAVCAASIRYANIVPPMWATGLIIVPEAG